MSRNMHRHVRTVLVDDSINTFPHKQPHVQQPPRSRATTAASKLSKCRPHSHFSRKARPQTAKSATAKRSEHEVVSRLDVHTAASALDVYRSVNTSVMKFRPAETIPETDNKADNSPQVEAVPVEVPKLKKFEILDSQVKVIKKLRTRTVNNLEDCYATVKGQKRMRRPAYKDDFKP